MKLYSALKSGMVYQQSGFMLPKGTKPGFGNAVFLLSPSRSLGYKLLTDSFLNYRTGLYKSCMIDFIYKEKVGAKNYVKNNTGNFKQEFNEIPFPSSITMVTNGNKVSMLKRKINLLVNLGEWQDIYFQHCVMKSVKAICENYITFIERRLNGEELLDSYNKIIYIDVDQWISENKKLGLSRKSLTNPVSIFLVTLYKFPELFNALLKGVDFVFVSSSGNSVMKIESADINQKNYVRLKQKILSLIGNACINESEMDETSVLNDEVEDEKSIDDMSTDELVNKVTNHEMTKQKALIKDKILATLSKNLMGDVDDITPEDDEDDFESESGDIVTDDDDINEAKNIASKFLDEHPELLDENLQDEAINKITQLVKKSCYVKAFKPKYTDEQLEEIKRLTDIQLSVIGDLDQEIVDMKTKIIDVSDYSNVVTTNNTNLTHSKFVNFDKSYNEKKLQKDIDNAVGQLANANTKVFITDKKETDTSTPTDLKKTLEYTLQDENGNKMKVKFDIPVIIDDHYMMLRGNKKVIQHMFVLKPLVKTAKDSVQIVTNYQKMFIKRKGSMDLKSNALLKFLTKYKQEYSVVKGNGVAINSEYNTTLEYDFIAKKIIEFTINENRFILDITRLKETMDEEKIKYDSIDLSKNILIGIDMVKKKPIYFGKDESFIDKIISYLDDNAQYEIRKVGAKSNGGRLLMYSKSTILNADIPLVLLLMYYEGFETVMKKANIEYEIIPKVEGDYPDVDLFEYGLIPMEDGYIKWKRYPSENSLLMNGFNVLPTHLYSTQDLESQDMFMYLLTNFFSYANQSYNLDQYYDFMIDSVTKEVLTDLHLPTDLVSLCILANKMLKIQDFIPINDMRNMRLRSNEVIQYHVYKAITAAYGRYRKTQHRKKIEPITVKQDAVIKSLLKQPASVMTDASSLNPVFELSSLRKVSYKGEVGTNVDKVFNLKVRSYNESMLGVAAITSSNDGGVGINRQLSLEPNITSTRGYIDVAGEKNVEELTSANLLAPSELLTPLGVQHDDPARTAMTYKQSIAMVLVEDSDPVLLGNGAEKVVPYHISSEFSIVAEDDGVVVDKQGDLIVIKYNNGKYRTIDTSLKINKNSSSGFYIESKMTCNLKVGDKVVKNEVVAWDDKAFKKSGNEKDVAMRLGPLVKVAVIPEWDIYEDSAPVTHAASERMATKMVMPVTVVLNKDAHVSKMIALNDHVNAGDTLIVYDDFDLDDDVKALISSLREGEREGIIESNATTKKTHYTGEVVDIDIVSTVELDELSESLRVIVSNHWDMLNKKEAVLDKYSNSNDLKCYKSGNLLTNTAGPIKPDLQGKVKGNKVDQGVIITFYISFKDYLARGDKLASQFALKGITSHVINKGLEPYSEFRPDEDIDLIVAPLSISARKTPSIFLAMFGNKLLIEAKRHLKDYWFEN